MNTEAPLLHARTALYPRDRRSVAAARALARAALADWGLTRRSDDVLLCVSELATNAVLHGVPPGRRFRLGLSVGGEGTLRVEVSDSGAGEPRGREPGAGDEHGRGLLLVAGTADRWGVEEQDPGKTVWCEFALPDALTASRGAS
ncbi:ATP-binding protein [Streptomyces sp. NPDC090106]|uniref:ATP-binding protein n=1 Tax=Streptomyces sp. NPDC090106 TaxID=3365946 RepID=UPI003806D7A1